jgi:hypothetical protein
LVLPLDPSILEDTGGVKEFKEFEEFRSLLRTVSVISDSRS